MPGIRQSRLAYTAAGTAARATPGRRSTKLCCRTSKSAGYRGPDSISAAVGCRDHVGTRASDKGQHDERSGEASRKSRHLFCHFLVVSAKTIRRIKAGNGNFTSSVDFHFSGIDAHLISAAAFRIRRCFVDGRTWLTPASIVSRALSMDRKSAKSSFGVATGKPSCYRLRMRAPCQGRHEQPASPTCR